MLHPLRLGPRRLDVAGLIFLKARLADLRLPRLETDDLYAFSANPGRRIKGRSRADEAHQELAGLLSGWSKELDAGPLGFAPRRLHKLKRYRPVYLSIAQEGAARWHVHGVALVPRCHVDAFERSAGAVWESITPGGDLHMEPQPDGGWLRYIARHAARGEPFTLQITPD